MDRRAGRVWRGSEAWNLTPRRGHFEGSEENVILSGDHLETTFGARGSQQRVAGGDERGSECQLTRESRQYFQQDVASRGVQSRWVLNRL